MTARDVARHASRIGAAVLPVAAIGGALLGVAWVLASGDAPRALATLVQRVPRALAPLLAGVLVAARVGAMMAGELAALREGRQLDWLRAAGLSSFRHVVAARLLAAALVMPVATLVAGAAVLAAASLLAGEHGASAHALAQLHAPDMWIGLAKSVLFGVTLSGVACATGLLARGRTDDVPRAAGRGAVAAMLAVVALDLALVASRLA